MSGLSFSRSFGFLENGHGERIMLTHLDRIFKYCAIVSRVFPRP